MTTPFELPLVCPVLVGREPQLGTLDRLIDQTAGGHGHTALIMGEAGVGKSRLIAETAQRVRWQHPAPPSPLLLQGRCFEPDRTLPYAPLRDLLRTYLATDRKMTARTPLVRYQRSLLRCCLNCSRNCITARHSQRLTLSRSASVPSRRLSSSCPSARCSSHCWSLSRICTGAMRPALIRC